MPARRTQSDAEKKKIMEATEKIKNIQNAMNTIEQKITDINEKMDVLIKKTAETEHKTLDAQDLSYFRNLYIDKQVYIHFLELLQDELSVQFFKGGTLR
jgi:hypothetical protein